MIDVVANWKPKTVWTGDCLDIMRGMNSESVDLIYLDPPFNSKANYAAPIGSKAAGAAFKDTGLASQKWRAPTETGGVLWGEESGLRRSEVAPPFRTVWRLS